MLGHVLRAALLLVCGLAGAAGFEPLAPGAHWLAGPALAAAAAPAGEAGNVGLLVGRRAALVVDAGASHRQGVAVLAALRRVTDVPVRLAVISHAQPEFLFGAAALQAAGIPLLAQRQTADLIAGRCAACLERFRQSYGNVAMAGSQVPVPDRAAAGDSSFDLGEREVRILDFGWASTPGDLAVLDLKNGILFAGGLVLVGRVPAIRDARLAAWIAALDRIATLPVRQIVPGHGPVVGANGVAPMRAYLIELEAEVRRLYAAQLGLSETIAAAMLPAYAGWTGYAETHRQNVHDLYLALEREELEAASRSPLPSGRD
jgi:glyoxylase-like metal-dependent hydrolase (beta-lactamase superfamily II)